MDPESTQELVRRVHAGDREALDRLLERHVPRLRRWARGRLPQFARDMAETDDMIQDALMRTIQVLDRFEHRSEGALQAYLRQAVMNRIRDELRRSGRRPMHDEMAEAAVDESPSPLEVAIGRENMARYEWALSQLSELEREGVVARIEMGCSFQEIAAIVEKPSADAARMAVTRALATLTQLMARHPEEK